MPRPRSVISPPLPPRASKPKPSEREDGWSPKPGMEYRARLTAEEPFGGFTRATYSGDLFELELLRAEWTAAGLDSIMEQQIRGGWAPLPDE